MPVPGDTLVTRISLLDASGLPIHGATFATQGRKPDGSAIAPSFPVDLGDGIYEIVIETDLSDPQGSYYLQAVSDTVPVQVFEREWIVKPLGTPARWRPGDTVQDYITVIGPDASPVVGDTFTIRAFNTVGDTILVAQPTDLGNGIYRVSITTSRFDPPGSYYISLVSNSDPTQVYEVEFETGHSVNLSGGTTLRDLRRRVMAKFGDIVTCRSTRNGSVTEFIDEDNLVGEPSRYAGREILFVTGLNAGQKRYIQGSSRNDMSVILQRPLPYPTAEGDEADITNAFGVGITFQSVDHAIREAIETARVRGRTPVSYTVTAWDGSGSIPIPVDAVGINDVYGVDHHGKQRHIRKGSGRGNGWRIDHTNRTITIGGHEASQARGYDITVNAMALPNLLIDDDDVTMIDAEWLVTYACAQLCLDSLLSRQASGDWGSKGMLYRQDAERMATRLTPNVGPNYTAVG